MVNGCGGEGSWFKPPYAIFFEASCNIHDENYELGGTEEDRLEADQGLLKYMCIDVRRLHIIKRPYYYTWCLLYYFAVRIGGKQYFNYKK